VYAAPRQAKSWGRPNGKRFWQLAGAGDGFSTGSKKAGIAVVLETLPPREIVGDRINPTASSSKAFEGLPRATRNKWRKDSAGSVCVCFLHLSYGNALDQIARYCSLTAIVQPGGPRVGMSGKVLNIAEGDALRE
jgi:hypothetical protein